MVVVSYNACSIAYGIRTTYNLRYVNTDLYWSAVITGEGWVAAAPLVELSVSARGQH